eukprot:871112-Pyramimonas_sp.AAC.1
MASDPRMFRNLLESESLIRIFVQHTCNEIYNRTRRAKERGINIALQYWLKRCGVFEGETAHGIRAGGSIEMPSWGEDLSTVMHRACWSSQRMAKYYMKEWQVMCASVAGATAPVQLPTHRRTIG